MAWILIILDLGSYINILTKNMWDRMGIPKLLWSLVQLRLSNEIKVLLIGRLPQVHVEVDGIRTHA